MAKRPKMTYDDAFRILVVLLVLGIFIMLFFIEPIKFLIIASAFAFLIGGPAILAWIWNTFMSDKEE